MKRLTRVHKARAHDLLLACNARLERYLATDDERRARREFARYERLARVLYS